MVEVLKVSCKEIKGKHVEQPTMKQASLGLSSWKSKFKVITTK